MNKALLPLMIAAAGLLAGCGSTIRPYNPENPGDTYIRSRHTITTTECIDAARAAAKSALTSDVFAKYLSSYHRENGADALPLAQVGDVKLSGVTDANVNPALVTDAFYEELLNSGVLDITMASGRDVAKSNAEVRDLEYDENFNQSTVKKRGTLDAPDLSFEGKIIQTSSKDDASGDRLTERSFEINVINLGNGRVVFRKTVRIGFVQD